MYRKVNYLHIIALAMLLGACDSGKNPLTTGYGNVSLNLSVDGVVDGVAGAASSEVSVPSVDALYISSSNNYEPAVKSWASLAKFEAGSKKLPIGVYTFSAGYGDRTEEGFVSPAFYGEASSDVREGRESSISIHCRVAQALVSTSFSDNAKALAQSIAMRAKTEEGGYVDFSSSESRTACLRPGALRCELALTDASGRSVALQPFDAISVEAATHHQFRFDADGNALTAVYDDATLATPFRLTVDDALFSTASPTIAPMGFDSGTFNMLEYSVPSSLGVNIAVPGGLQNLYFTVISSSMDDNYWSTETDLAAVDVATLASEGIVATGLEKGSTSVSLDLSQIVSRMTAGTSTTEHRIIIQARDLAGRVALSPSVLTVTTRPVAIALKQPAALLPSADRVQVEVECNGDLPVEQLSFEVKGVFSSDVWDAVDAISLERTGVGRYLAVLPLTPSVDGSYVRAVFNGGVKMSDPVSVVRSIPQYAVACERENIWPSQVDLMFSGDNLSEIIPYINVLVQPSGGSWHPAVVERSVADGRITVKTLTPSTSYNIRITTGVNDTHEFSVSTESALELPNADFEDVTETIKMKSVNCGGKYSNLSSWMPIYNKADILVSEPKKWASVNKKTCASFASNSNTWFQVPTTEIIASMGSGQWSVRIRNAAWSWEGVEPPRDARTDRQYYSSYTPDNLNRSAGKLFLGSYDVDKSGKETYNEGIAFTSRPTAVSGTYTYVQDYHDTSETGMVVVRLVNDESGKAVEIGRGVGYLNPSTSLTRFNVPITYSVRNKRATRLMLMVTSSNHASYSIAEETRAIRTTDRLQSAVSLGAELTIDQLALLYE